MVQQSFSYRLLSVPVPSMIHSVAAMRKTLPRNGGTTLRMRRYNPLNTALVPLGNSGVTPPPQTQTVVDIDAKMSFFGTFILLNEQVTLQSQDPVLNEVAARLGVSLRQTEDTLIRDMLTSTASFINCVGGVNGDNPTEITRSDVNTVVKALLNANSFTIMDSIAGQDRFGTAPIRASFFSLSNTNLTGDLDAVSGYVNVAQYPSPMNALPSELIN